MLSLLADRFKVCSEKYRTRIIALTLGHTKILNWRTRYYNNRPTGQQTYHAYELSSSAVLRSVGSFRTDVSGRRIGPIFKGQDVQENILTLKDGTDTYSRNVGAKPN